MGRGGRIVLDRASTTMDDLWSSLDFKIFDSEKSQTRHADANYQQDSIVGDAVPSIKVETDVPAVDSVVVDLVTPLNRKYSVDSVARTRAPASVGENIVIKSEQNTVLNIKQESMDGWDSGLTTSVPSTPISVSEHRFSAIAGRASSFSAALRRTVSQSGVHPSNTRNCSRNLNSNANPTGSFYFTKSDSFSGGCEDPCALGQLQSSSQPTDDTKPVSYDECSRKDEELFGDFLSEIRRDWLHFRPKTPPPRTEEDDDLYDFGQPTVEYTNQTQLQVEIQCLGSQPPSSILTDDVHNTNSLLLLNESDNNLFLTNPFTLDEIMDDTEDVARLEENSTTPASLNDISLSSGNDINSIGDSLPELSLSLGENEANDKMLENILEECQFDEQSFNTNPNFWNGILEDAGALCEVLDDATLKKSVFDKIGTDATMPNRSSKHRQISHKTQPVGCSTFSISNIPKEEFFKKEEPKSPTNDKPIPADDPPSTPAEIKLELVEPVTPVSATVNLATSTVRTGVPCPPLVGVSNPLIQVVQQVVNNSPANKATVIKVEPQDEAMDTVKFVKNQFLPAVVKTEIVQSSQLPQIVNMQSSGNILIQNQLSQQGIIQLMQQKPQQHIIQPNQQQHQVHTVVQQQSQLGGSQQKTFVIPHQTIQLQQNNQTLSEGTLLVSASPSTIRRQNNGPTDKNGKRNYLS